MHGLFQIVRFLGICKMCFGIEESLIYGDPTYVAEMQNQGMLVPWHAKDRF